MDKAKQGSAASAVATGLRGVVAAASSIGDVNGEIRANTKAGDIQIQAARSGGQITTGGGILRLLYAGGPTRLQSGGGDITVRQANSTITAQTRSGDISITMDAASQSRRSVAVAVIIWSRISRSSVELRVTLSSTRRLRW